MSCGRNIVLIAAVVVVYICLSNRPEVKKVQRMLRPLSSSSFLSTRTESTDDIWKISPSVSAANSTGVGRRPDDGVWYDFSDAPSLIFFAYSAFIDDRPLAPDLCNECFAFQSHVIGNMTEITTVAVNFISNFRLQRSE